jgi:cytochrome bd-type quinol oxidase subunit 2
VTIEIIVLALASTIRPTSLAAVYALIAGDSRRGLMAAYVAGGLVFTLAFGAVVVGVSHGIHVHSGTDKTKAIADIAGGTIAVLFGLAILTGRIRGNRSDDAPRTEGRMSTMLDRRLTVRAATLAGPITHIPGLFYLIALNVIIAHNDATIDKSIALVTYNAIWFALPIAALVACIVHPTTARDAVGSVEQWARSHARSILLVVSFGAGSALVIRGVLAL